MENDYLKALNERRNAIRFENDLSEARQAAGARDRKLARAILAEKLRDPWWWLKKLYRPKLVFALIVLGMAWSFWRLIVEPK